MKYLKENWFSIILIIIIIVMVIFWIKGNENFSQEKFEIKKEIEQLQIEERKLNQDKLVLQSQIIVLNKKLDSVRDARKENNNTFAVIDKQEQDEKNSIRDLTALDMERKLTERARQRSIRQANGTVNH